MSERYEDSSLPYTGIDRHAGETVGGYDTVLTREEYDRLSGAQRGTRDKALMNAIDRGELEEIRHE